MSLILVIASGPKTRYPASDVSLVRIPPLTSGVGLHLKSSEPCIGPCDVKSIISLQAYRPLAVCLLCLAAQLSRSFNFAHDDVDVNLRFAASRCSAHSCIES